MRRLKVSGKTTCLALQHVRLKLARQLLKKGNDALASPCEGLGVVTEEYYELITAVHGNKGSEYVAELLDVAVAAIWALASYYEYVERGDQ